MTHISQNTFKFYIWVLKYVHIWWGFSLYTFLQVSIWKRSCWKEKENKQNPEPLNTQWIRRQPVCQEPNALLDQSEEGLPSSEAVTATPVHAHLDFISRWTQLLHLCHFRAQAPKLSNDGGCVRGGGPWMERCAAGPSCSSLHPDSIHSWKVVWRQSPGHPYF